MPRARYYLGFKHGTIQTFKAIGPVTEAEYGTRYLAVLGPFRTRRAALFCRRTWPNVHVQTVQDAERIARRLQL